MVIDAWPRACGATRQNSIGREARGGTLRDSGYELRIRMRVSKFDAVFLDSSEYSFAKATGGRSTFRRRRRGGKPHAKIWKGGGAALLTTSIFFPRAFQKMFGVAWRKTFMLQTSE